MKTKDKWRRTLSSFTTSQRTVEAQAWKCPEDGTVVLVIPSGEPVPTETEQVQCPNGHWVTVPKYRGPQPDAESFTEGA